MRIKNLIRGLMFVVRCATMLVSGFCATDGANHRAEVVDIETIRSQLGAIDILKNCAKNGIINLGQKMNELEDAIRRLPVSQRTKMFELTQKENPGLERAPSKNLLQIGNTPLTTPSGSSSSTRVSMEVETPLSKSPSGSTKRASSEPPRLASRQTTFRTKTDAIDLQSPSTKQREDVILQEASELREIIKQMRRVIGDLQEANQRNANESGQVQCMPVNTQTAQLTLDNHTPATTAAPVTSTQNSETQTDLRVELGIPENVQTCSIVDFGDDQDFSYGYYGMNWANLPAKSEPATQKSIALLILRASSNLLPYFISF